MSETIIISRCPLCYMAVIIHPGLPPSTKPNEYFNRCIGPGLTGEPSNIKDYFRDQLHWHPPMVLFSKKCGMELTHMDGSLVNEIPDTEYMKITLRKFDPKALRLLIIQRSAAKMAENPEVP